MAISRRGWWGLGAVATVAGGGIAAAPLIAGWQIERSLEEQVAAADGVELHDVAIERGYRRSEVRLELEIGDVIGARYLAWAREPLHVVIDGELEHGPLVRSRARGWEQALARLDGAVQPPPRLRQWAPNYFAEGGWQVEALLGVRGDWVAHIDMAEGAADFLDFGGLSGEVAVDPQGQAMFYAVVPSLRLREGQAALELEELRLEGAEETRRGRGRHIGGRLAAEKLRFDDPTATGAGALEAHGLAVAVNGERAGDTPWQRLEADWDAAAVEAFGGGVEAAIEDLTGQLRLRRDQGLWVGRGEVRGGGYRVDDGRGETLQLGPWRLAQQLDLEGGLASLSLEGAVEGDGETQPRGSARLALQQLDAASVAAVGQILPTVWTSGDPYQAGFLFSSRLLERLPDLLAAQPRLQGGFDWEGPSGSATGQLEASYRPDEGARHRLPDALVYLYGQGALSADRAVIENALALMVAAEAEQAGAEPGDELDARAAEAAREQVGALIAGGWLVEDEADRLEAEGRLQRLRLRVNEREVGPIF